ncbi:MAG: glycosyl transferase family 2 [Treponematales bacterium]
MITASIVLYNSSYDQLKTVTDSYAPSENRLLYLVDNSPRRTELGGLVSSPYIDYCFTGANRGYGAGHNIAMRAAIEKGAEYHVVLNPDVRFEPPVIDRIADYMDSEPAAAQVMPKIVNQHGELQYLCKLIPTPADLFIKRFLPRAFHGRLEKYQLKFADYDKPMNVPYLSGCFMFFRTAALRDVGLFDERFFMYPEDIDITRRMYQKYKTMYYPAVVVVHEHAAASYKNIRMLRIHAANMIRYFNKWGWFFDRERKAVNNRVLRELGYKR